MVKEAGVRYITSALKHRSPRFLPALREGLHLRKHAGANLAFGEAGELGEVANCATSQQRDGAAEDEVEVDAIGGREVTTIGDAGEEASPLSGVMGVQMEVMPLMMLSLVMSLIALAVTRLQDAERTRASKAREAGVQVGYALVASLAAAVAAYGIAAWSGGLAVPAQAILLLWLASACIMLANLGLLSVSVPLGAIVMLCVFSLGMSTAVLPPEMTPAFWTDWVFPWAPQAAIGEGLRNIIYLGGGAFDVGVPSPARLGMCRPGGARRRHPHPLAEGKRTHGRAAQSG